MQAEIAAVRRALDETEAEYGQMPMIVRLMVRRGFVKRTGRDFAAVSSYCIWIMLASLFPSSGPHHWILLGILFTWFLCVQCLNELRRNREQITDWKGPDGWPLLRPLFGFAAFLLIGISAFAGTLYVLLPRAPIAAFHLDFKPLRRIIGFSRFDFTSDYYNGGLLVEY